MKKIMVGMLAVFGLFGAAQACEIEGHVKWCVEVARTSEKMPQVFVGGKVSEDFKVERMYGSYIKVNYLKPITENVKAELVFVNQNGKEEKRPISVTTKLINDGSKIESNMSDFIKKFNGK
jgi:hypothetical protein